MKIDVTPNRIEGWCNMPGWRGRHSVIVFSTIHGEWHTASSMCLPSDIEAAKIVHECIEAAFKELEKITGDKL